MKRKSSPLAKAKKKAWDACSLYIRLKYSDWRGHCECVTCHKVDHYKKMQAGHFIQGRHNSTLFDERHIHVQCPGCNLFKNGNLYWYGKFMEKTYGQKVIDELFKLDKTTVKYTIVDYERIAEEFKTKTKPYEGNRD